MPRSPGRSRLPSGTSAQKGRVLRTRLSRCAFTLIELLVPAVQRVREADSRTQCLNNLKQVALAAHNHHGNYKRFPVGSRPAVDVAGRPAGGTNLFVELLPYFEQDNLYKKWDTS